MISFILPFLQKYWKQVAYITFVAIIFAFGWYKGYAYEKTAYDAYKHDVEVKSAAQAQKNAETAAKQKEVTDNLAKGYADAVKKLNDYYRNANVGWMQPRCDSKTVSEISNTTSKPDGKTESYQVNPSGVNPLDCASDVLQLLYLQKWIKDQQLVQ